MRGWSGIYKIIFPRRPVRIEMCLSWLFNGDLFILWPGQVGLVQGFQDLLPRDAVIDLFLISPQL